MESTDDTSVDQVIHDLLSYLSGICPLLLNVDSHFFSSNIQSSINRDILSKFASSSENNSLLVGISSDEASGKLNQLLYEFLLLTQ